MFELFATPEHRRLLLVGVEVPQRLSNVVYSLGDIAEARCDIGISDVPCLQIVQNVINMKSREVDL